MKNKRRMMNEKELKAELNQNINLLENRKNELKEKLNELRKELIIYNDDYLDYKEQVKSLINSLISQYSKKYKIEIELNKKFQGEGNNNNDDGEEATQVINIQAEINKIEKKYKDLKEKIHGLEKKSNVQFNVQIGNSGYYGLGSVVKIKSVKTSLFDTNVPLEELDESLVQKFSGTNVNFSTTVLKDSNFDGGNFEIGDLSIQAITTTSNNSQGLFRNSITQLSAKIYKAIKNELLQNNKKLYLLWNLDGETKKINQIQNILSHPDFNDNINLLGNNSEEENNCAEVIGKLIAEKININAMKITKEMISQGFEEYQKTIPSANKQKLS